MMSVPPAIAELTSPAFRAMAHDLNTNVRAELDGRLHYLGVTSQEDMLFLVHEITVQSACIGMTAVGGIMQQSYHRGIGYAEFMAPSFEGAPMGMGYGAVRHTGFRKGKFEARMEQLRHRRDLVARQFINFGFLVGLDDGYTEPSPGVRMGEFTNATISWGLPS